MKKVCNSIKMLEKIINPAKKTIGTALFCGAIAVISSLNGCEKSDEKKGAKKETETIEQIVTKEDARRYFPLAVGNTWTYKRTVNSPPLHFCKYRVEEAGVGSEHQKGGNAVEWGYNHSVKSGMERYSILSKEKDDWFNILVKDPDTTDGENDLAYGRYGFQRLDKVGWILRSDDVCVSVWEKLIGEYDLLGKNVRSDRFLALLTPYILRRIDPCTISTKGKEEEKTYWREIICEKYGGVIEVPAGKFEKCIRNTEKFMFMEEEPEFGNVTNIKFYAGNIGLVKEVQYNPKGEIIYQLELVDYKVK